ncbi:polysaccharide pyruvyl transferase family protein [Marinobacter sp.]|uniref:polysaccharide pyruvyl transferase family protein n=1 Tax=Marinobacter sp. TaxID=50741 RepID=UPI002B26483A|nr:polysaccharide pyruvyl transferase family protein [Marinobacter sp.]
MRQLRKNILHIASFNGNVGDNASHNGFYEQIQAACEWEACIEQREIRKTYLNYDGADRWHWDEQLINNINKKDLTVIGGGNYFELWLDKSNSGTTIDLRPELLKQVRRPLFFNAVGCDPNIGVSGQAVKRFRQFLDAALANPFCLVSVRNDGSSKYLRQYVGEELSSQILVTPDPGFFIGPGNSPLPYSLQNKTYWVINLAIDRPERRFPGADGKLNYDGFLDEVTSLVCQACNLYPEIEIIFVPHIYSDLSPIRDLIEKLPDTIRRWRVSVAPLLHGMGSEKTIFRLYQGAQLTFGMRFHANVCPIGLGTPSIGLATTEKLFDLYEELKMPERVVNAQTPGFAEQALSLAKSSLTSYQGVLLKYRTTTAHLLNQAQTTYKKMAELAGP